MATQKTREKIIKTFLNLLSENDWADVTLEKLASEAGLSLADLRKAYDGKIAIWTDFAQAIDAEVLENLDEDLGDEIPRERLMDVLLSRLDAMAPHKTAIGSVVAAAKDDLTIAAQLNQAALVSHTWMLNAAGIDTSGLRGAARVQGSVITFSKVLKTWLADEDPGMAKTMAALDKELRKAERNMKRFERGIGLASGIAKFARRGRAARKSRFDKPVSEESAPA